MRPAAKAGTIRGERRNQDLIPMPGREVVEWIEERSNLTLAFRGQLRDRIGCFRDAAPRRHSGIAGRSHRG